MKHLILILLFLCTTSIFGQEICNNGIDDDGDTYIDLNDTADCSCVLGTPPFPSVSLIPNPSFELKNCCPTTYSDFDNNYTCATSWSTAITNSTPDYLNRCNYVSQALTTASLTLFPDGEACSGVLFCQDYKEYIATCLTTPLIAGTEYRLRFNLASINVNPYLNNCYVGFNNTWGPTDIAIFGKKTCSNIPKTSITNSCLAVADTSWSELGTVSYTPSATWGVAYITFTPTTTINAFAIGSPCNFPAFYPNMSLVSADCLPYFVFDNLILNTTSHIGFVNISATGHYCTNNLILKANIVNSVASSTIQWYYNGIAITGATNSTYAVPSGTAGIGNYLVMLDNGGTCYSSTNYAVTSDASILSVNSRTLCLPASGVLTATSLAVSNYTWSTGATTKSITVNPNTTTVYTVSAIYGSCLAQATSTVTVLFGASAPITVNANSVTVCPYTPVILTGGGSANWYWWNNGSIFNTLTPLVVTPSVTTTYTFSGAIGLCQSSKTITINVLPTPTITVTPNNISICPGRTEILTANGATTYTWNNGTVSNTIAVTPSVITTYSVTGTLASCNGNSTSKIKPDSTFNDTYISYNAAMCPGSSNVLTAYGSATTFSWSNGDTSNTTAVSPTIPTTYTVTGFIGYCANTATAAVYLVDPISYSITADTLICIGESAALISTSSNPTSVLHYNIQGPEFASPFYYFTNTIVVTPTVTSTYTIICQPNQQPCTSISSITIHVETCTDINDIKNSTLVIANPNPVNEWLSITLANSLINDATIEVYDVTGKLLISEPLVNETTKIWMSNLSKGIYMLRIIAINKQQIIKVIKD